MIHPSDAFRFKNRGETLEYRRGADLFQFEVTWSLHVRLFVDADLVTVNGTRVESTERRTVLREVVDFLRTQTQDRIEVVGEPGLGDEVKYSVPELRAETKSADRFRRNSAIHELQRLAGDDAAGVWYRVLREDPDELCLASAFGLLLHCAGANAALHLDVLTDLSRSLPGAKARDLAMKRLKKVLSAHDPGLLSRMRVGEGDSS
jgi:hypothetical protein